MNILHYLVLIICFSLTDTPQVLSDQPQGNPTMTFDYKSQTDDFWKSKLNEDSQIYHVCRGRGTEKPHSGKYDKFYEKGTYHCACCGGDFPLYSSEAKFDSGTGWPSFSKPIDQKHVMTSPDGRVINWFLGARTEVTCARCGSHLGHVFDDGPKEMGGKRYCMNSVALAFVPEGQSPKRAFDNRPPA